MIKSFLIFVPFPPLPRGQLIFPELKIRYRQPAHDSLFKPWGIIMIMNVRTLDWIEQVKVQPKGFAPVTAELLQNIVQRIVTGLHPQKIVLFGSYAYGLPSPDSDLDILVIMQTTERPAERVLAISRLLRPRPFPMDILVRTPDEIAEAVKQNDLFIQEILSRGKVLYEQSE